MFLDLVSYYMKCQKRIKNFDFNSLEKNKILYISFYSSDNKKYIAHSYEFSIYNDNKYYIMDYVKFSNVKTISVPRCIQMSLYEYLQVHNDFIILTPYLNECVEYPFSKINKSERMLVNCQTQKNIKLKALKAKFYHYCIPVENITDDNSMLSTNPLQYILNKMNLIELVDTKINDYSSDESDSDNDIDKIVKFINS